MENDRCLIVTAKQPQQNWDLWLEENASRFLLFARSQTRNEMDAQDVLQEALLACWKRANQMIPPSAWVFRSIRSKAIDRARESDRRSKREIESAQSIGWFEPNIMEREMGRILESAIKELPETLCEVLILKIWGGLKFREIAEALEIPGNTAASRYRMALERMKKQLKGALV
jgi:RNA polymerase sigma-70 factor, ECF subfamily